MAKVLPGHYCKTPKFRKVKGAIWYCPDCSTGFRYVEQKGDDRYGRPKKGRGYWLQISR